ncbi:MAG: hypothetical protein US50_C0017G0007 [Candidatus Nomurabacteria bacterium GW2011_GWB1_37_5]|uniref:Uncharacterized protein n=1 Tax=Candidatus Nomurabacteria bacterium GW2011_GWB1_37_5 TaxID=1618742 RepID=A0A0G0K3Y3_9BACT|nr:MAG: hypothetical protein US50_C0017G0007 [Candidatus Nomurabacteria bacterium GW2011_GWB1_37_5]
MEKSKWMFRILRYSILAMFIPGLSWLLGGILIEIFNWYTKLFSKDFGYLKYILVSIIIGIIIEYFVSRF